MRDVRAETRARCPELADALEAACAAPLRFEGPDPWRHSADNHVHLWALEWWAERLDWIDTDYRVAFARTVTDHWRGRLRGLWPHRATGYRVYLYADLAPTLSVVADTPQGCPYAGVRRVATRHGVMAGYADRRWSDAFGGAWEVSPERVLAAVERNAGSIAKPTAQALGMQVGHLRTLIEAMGIDDRVNALRKRHGRRPARFRDPFADAPGDIALFEEHWPAGY
ncbi:hypothetical protein DXV76_11925 [Rhodobacteraceae bacterium CCMM004]|nr:hypothetical protein DXV76_11925 [Rhodobacteraceae bacterium CCMM004]